MRTLERMYKLELFLLGCGVVAVLAVLFRPLGLENVVAGVGVLFIAYALFFYR